jgi:hypothetical protein
MLSGLYKWSQNKISIKTFSCKKFYFSQTGILKLLNLIYFGTDPDPLVRVTGSVDPDPYQIVTDPAGTLLCRVLVCFSQLSDLGPRLVRLRCFASYVVM